MITNAEYEEQRNKWMPQIEQFVARNYVPYMDDDDLRQELEEVLWNCLKGFDPEKKVKFHTFLFTSLGNKVGHLKQGFKSRGKDSTPKRMPPQCGISLTLMESSEEPAFQKEQNEFMTVQFEESLRFSLEDYGFEGEEELTYMEGRVYSVTLKETAKLFQMPEEAVKQGYRTAMVKIQRIREAREEEVRLCQYRDEAEASIPRTAPAVAVAAASSSPTFT